ncbi:hypothetical protein TRIP_D300136 [uncultured Paludibacter sp.]|uniref:Uncharacterized protein n=1 Tax=uncultured Paludibacter sp. TaxID=497635 RepID=A0A653AAY8_9BACT|nr:hypothetical protein TRIP_D300136 [uncultured Paludibacter sp.]
MIANVDKVIEWLEINETPFFTVQTREGENNKIFETREDESFEDAKARLRRVMEFSTGNRFIIRAKKEAKATRGSFTEEFRNLPENTIPPGNNQNNIISGMPGVGFVSIGELEKKVKDTEERILERVKYQRIEDENKELKEELRSRNDTLDRVVKKLEPHVGLILSNVVSKIIPHPGATAQVGVAGIESEPEDINEFNPLDEERLEAALQRFSSAEPDFIRIIEKLAEMAEKQDAMYLMAKSQLFK